MAVNGRKVGDIRNTKGNLLAMGDGSQAHKVMQKSRKGYYYVDFSKKYRGVSEKDIELKEDYALELIAIHTGINQQLLRLHEKKENLTLTSLDTVYYVHQGAIIIGKMSISVRRYGNINELLFIYHTKSLLPRRASYITQIGSKKQGGSRKVQNRRNSHKKKKSEKRTY